MDDDAKIIGDAEVREAALARLREAVRDCLDTDLTRDEILQAVRPLFSADDVLIEGDVFDHLEDGEGTTIIRLLYGVIPQGGTIAFGVTRRSRRAIEELCDAAGVPKANITISHEGNALRVAVMKLQ